ncbi:MAG: hypothetical protein AAFR61_14520 [Bacteroidota bacterium]
MKSSPPLAKKSVNKYGLLALVILPVIGFLIYEIGMAMSFYGLGRDIEKGLNKAFAAPIEGQHAQPPSLVLDSVMGFNDWANYTGRHDSGEEVWVYGLQLNRTDSLSLAYEFVRMKNWKRQNKRSGSLYLDPVSVRENPWWIRYGDSEPAPAYRLYDPAATDGFHFLVGKKRLLHHARGQVQIRKEGELVPRSSILFYK